MLDTVKNWSRALILLSLVLLSVACAAACSTTRTVSPAPEGNHDGLKRANHAAVEQTQRRARILQNMERVMGPLPSVDRKVPLDPIYGETVAARCYIRKKLSFAVARGQRVPAYLLIPTPAKGPLPAVLALHQTNGALGKKEPAGVGGSPNLHYAVELAERGYVTLAPDYPSFGEYRCDFSRTGFQSGSMMAVWNNMRAIDFLQSLPEVDPKRFGCIGHSLGGHNAMFTAAFDDRIKALVSNCGFTSFRKYYHGDLRGWTSARYMPRIRTVFHLDPAPRLSRKNNKSKRESKTKIRKMIKSKIMSKTRNSIPRLKD